MLKKIDYSGSIVPIGFITITNYSNQTAAFLTLSCLINTKSVYSKRFNIIENVCRKSIIYSIVGKAININFNRNTATSKWFNDYISFIL